MKRAAAAGSAPSTSASGAVRCRATSAGSRPLLDAGVMGVKCFLPDSGRRGVPGAVGDGLLARREPSWPPPTGCCSCTPRTPRCWPRRRRRAAGTYARFLASRPRGGRGRRDRRASSTPPGDRRPGARRAPVQRQRAAGARRGQGRRRARSRWRPARTTSCCAPRTCPTARRRSSAARRCAATPTGTRSGPASPTAPSTSSSATTRRARPTSRRWTPATSARPGAASRRCSSACRWSGPRRAGAATTWPTSCAGWPPAPAALVGLATKGGIRVGAAADLVAFAPDAELVVDPARLHHRNPVTPYAGRAADRRGARDVVGWDAGRPTDGRRAAGCCREGRRDGRGRRLTR